ncbi:hypothetical protein K1T71_007688 [Dendrolimus kikuchii]|uniref:Uncharacterized protein n=1 Tax=Dendrolimus kikuchii TaxID=765133 RepID=A0ACC1CXS2_9NEOP|nr:hypothetical protein K1T71_007688 [Dendrolimus kikuchii]
MGLIQSIFCSVTFCMERVLTWTCCAFVIMLMLFIVIMLMIYGISVGYHYAQKELSSFSSSSKSTTESTALRSGPERPVVRLVAVNRSEVENAPPPVFEIYQTKRPGEQVYIETSETPFVVLETERPPHRPELSPHERELARRLIGRFRRSRNNSSTNPPFFRPLNSSEPVSLIYTT